MVSKFQGEFNTRVLDIDQAGPCGCKCSLLEIRQVSSLDSLRCAACGEACVRALSITRLHSAHSTAGIVTSQQ